MNAHHDDAAERPEWRLTDESRFESLQNPRRRWTLRYLTEQDGPVTVGDLADQVTAWEQRVDVADIRPEARKSVYNSLTQTHLPHLAERGIVEYDRAGATIALAPNAAQLASYLPLSPSVEDRWSRIVLATTAVAGVIAVANWFGVFAPAIAPMVLNVVVIGLFLAVSLAFATTVRS